MTTSLLLAWPTAHIHLPLACLAHPFPYQHPPPSLSADKPCELYCSPLGKESPLLVADRVLDGTPCGPYEIDLCVHGRCQVTCFPCVLARALKGRLPLPRGAWAGAEAWGRCGGMGFLKKAPVALPSAAWHRLLPQQGPGMKR